MCTYRNTTALLFLTCKHHSLQSSQCQAHIWLSVGSLRSSHIHPHSPYNHLNLYLRVCFHGAALYELEKEPAYWDAQARATLDAALKLRPRDHQAKNIILFLGDGRSRYHYGIYSSKHSILTWLWLRLKFETEKKTTAFSLNDKYRPIYTARQCLSVFSYSMFGVLKIDLCN